MESWQLTDLEAPAGTRDPIVLASADGARAVMIALSPGQELRDHEVKERAWVTVVEGRAEIRSNGDLVEAGTGSLLTFAPGERHSVASDGGARILLFLAPWPAADHYRPAESSV